MGPDAMIFVIWMLSSKPASSLSSFTFIKRLLSSSSLSAIRVVSSTYQTLWIFLPQSWFQLVLHAVYSNPESKPESRFVPMSITQAPYFKHLMQSCSMWNRFCRRASLLPRGWEGLPVASLSPMGLWPDHRTPGSQRTPIWKPSHSRRATK